MEGGVEAEEIKGRRVVVVMGGRVGEAWREGGKGKKSRLEIINAV